MLNVTYSETFLKDLKALKSTQFYKKIKHICFEELPVYEKIHDIKNLMKIEGHDKFFRLKTGEYRIGLFIHGNTVDVLRVLHRKDIYKYFP